MEQRGIGLAEWAHQEERAKERLAALQPHVEWAMERAKQLFLLLKPHATKPVEGKEDPYPRVRYETTHGLAESGRLGGSLSVELDEQRTVFIQKQRASRPEDNFVSTQLSGAEPPIEWTVIYAEQSADATTVQETRLRVGPPIVALLKDEAVGFSVVDYLAAPERRVGEGGTAVCNVSTFENGFEGAESYLANLYFALESLPDIARTSVS